VSPVQEQNILEHEVGSQCQAQPLPQILIVSAIFSSHLISDS
jgi:multisubunit Na+/H+ antiporter MnhC subunit